MEIRLLGTVEAHVDGRPPPALAPQQRLLLAALAVDAGRVVPVEKLVDRVWDDPPAQARTGLQVLVARLRRALEVGADSPAVIRHRDGGYVLDVVPDAVDVHLLDGLVRTAREPGRTATERLNLLRRARELWRGEPLTGLPGAWSASTRETWRRQYLDAIVAWAQAELETGNPLTVIGPLAEASTQHPLAEPIVEELMRALAMAGRPAEALESFAALRTRLAEELGADPGPRLQTTHRAILRGEPPQPGATARDPRQPRSPQPDETQHSGTQTGRSQGGRTQHGSAQSGSQGGWTQAGGPQHDGTHGGRTQHDSTQGGATAGGGGPQGNGPRHGGTQDGTSQDRGNAQDRGTQHGTAQHGGAWHGGTLRDDPDSQRDSTLGGGSVDWSVPALLPPDITDFTGRESTVEHLVQELSSAGGPATPLVVIGVAGMAGIGKTALTVRVAHRVAAAYPDGQLYVDLRGVATKPVEPVDALGRLLHAMGVDSRAVPADPVECAQMYRSRLAGRRVLVVLDNAGSEEQVRALLPGTGTCAVLVTGRAPLTGLEGVRWSHLDVFSQMEAIALLGRLGGTERVARDPADAAAIVRLCGLLPLAVRIAGARLASRPAWPLARLAAQLEDERRRLDRLTTGDLGVRSSLGLSYGALDDAGRRLLRGLGLFELPDFPGWLAAAVLDMPLDTAETLLEQLVDAQLVVDASTVQTSTVQTSTVQTSTVQTSTVQTSTVQTSTVNASTANAGTDIAGQSRYRYHDLVRLFARERAEAEDSPERRAEVLRAGFGVYLGLAERLAEAIPGPCYAAVHGSAPRTRVDGLTDPIDALAWFDAERSALAATIRQLCTGASITEGGGTSAAFDLAGCLEKYFDLRGLYADWRVTNELVLAACQATGDRLGEAVMLRGLIEIRTWHSNEHPEHVMDHLYADASRLAELFESAGEERGLADALVEQAWALSARGEYTDAAACADRSLQLAEKHHHLGGTARAHVVAAVAHGENRRIDLAAHHLTRALHAARLLGNARYEATVLQFIGIMHTRTGNFAAAEPLLEASLAIARRYQDRYAEALTLLTLARMHLGAGDPRARSAAEAALAIGRQYTLPHHIADALTVLGDIDLAEGRPEEAVRHLEESVRVWRTRGWPSFLADALISLGRAYAASADPAAARRCWTEGRDLLTALGHHDRAHEVATFLTTAH